jgi:hypothetical protein
VDGRVESSGVFVGFSRMFLLGVLIFKVLTAGRLYMSFGVMEIMEIMEIQHGTFSVSLRFERAHFSSILTA